MTGPVQFSFANAKEAAPGAVKAEFGEVLAEDVVAPAPVRRPQASKKPAPKNVVALAKARLREVKIELRRLKALEKERDELERLIAAAENKPRAVVRELKRSAG